MAIDPTTDDDDDGVRAANDNCPGKANADQLDLDRVSLSAIRRYQAEGHFPAGSMGPKIEAAIRFLEGGGRRAIITSLDTAVPALRGETGTHIVPDADFNRAPVELSKCRHVA